MGQVLGILGDEDAWAGMDLVGDGIRNAAQFRDKGPMETAFQNELILRNFFSHIPTNLLLSSCSLVSKTWNKQARKFIRDCRKCTVKNSECTSVCEFLQELDQLCHEITKDGRLVPFNSLMLDFGKPCCDDLNFSDQDFYGNIKSGLKLKYLAIQNEWIDRPDCPSHKPLLTLLKQKDSGLQSLCIDSIHPLKYAFCSRWLPQFTNLEELDIAGMGLWLQKPPESVQKELVRWLLSEGPNLKRITAGALKNLRIVPEEILARVTLQGRLEIHLQTKQDLDLLHTVSNRAFKLQEICIHEPNSVLRDDQDDDGIRLRYQFDILVYQMLQMSHQTLKAIEIVGAYCLPHFSPQISLVNVTKFIVKEPNKGASKKLWHAIASIDFERFMPALEEVEATIHCDRFPRAEKMRNQLMMNNGSNNAVMKRRSGNNLSLKLYLKQEEINLGPLQAIFPNFSTIDLTLLLEHSAVSDSVVDPGWTCRPVAQIFKYWPDMVEFNLIGKRVPSDGNYDADFCGIHKEEAELLSQMDEEYLRGELLFPLLLSDLARTRCQGYTNSG